MALIDKGSNSNEHWTSNCFLFSCNKDIVASLAGVTYWKYSLSNLWWAWWHPYHRYPYHRYLPGTTLVGHPNQVKIFKRFLFCFSHSFWIGAGFWSDSIESESFLISTYVLLKHSKGILDLHTYFLFLYCKNSKHLKSVCI